MSEIQVNLPDSIGEFAGAQVAAGRFSSVSEYLGALVTADEQAQKAVEGLAENPQLAALLEEGLNGGEGRRWSIDVLREMKQQVLDRASENQT
jgi:putative addiction module CopG family antidote